MNPFRWIAGHFSSRGKALSLYKRGMSKARKHDHQGAIEDYTTTLGMESLPDDVRAMVLFNRGIAYVAAGEKESGETDLHDVLAMDVSFPNINVQTMARRKLERMNS